MIDTSSKPQDMFNLDGVWAGSLEGAVHVAGNWDEDGLAGAGVLDTTEF